MPSDEYYLRQYPTSSVDEYVIIRNRGSNKTLEQDKSSIIAVSSILRDQSQVWKRLKLPHEKYSTFMNMQSGMVLDNFASTELRALNNDIDDQHHQWELCDSSGPDPGFVFIINRKTRNRLDHYRGWDDNPCGQFVQAVKPPDALGDVRVSKFHEWSIEPIWRWELPPRKVCKL